MSEKPTSRRPATMLAVALLVTACPARAETSSWSTRTDTPPPAAAAPKPRTIAKPQPLAPKGGKLPGGALPAAGAELSRLQAPNPPRRVNAHKLPVSGEDAALIAFNQGQYLTALGLAEAAAGRGSAQAYTMVGRIYADGLGVPKDDIGAARWFARGAELGDVDAQFTMGVLFAEGTGVPKDKAAAAEMFQQAARTGHVLANYNLALMFLSGDGKPENPMRAALHLAYAAEKGVAAAQYDLATLYATGHGVKADAYEAARWMRRAAEQGMAEAEYDYAVMLLRGQGLNADQPKAFDFLRAAAEKGVAGAQNRLAHLILEGVRAPRNPREAAKWRLLAKTAGLADDDLDGAIAKLSAAERTAADLAAREWRERRLVEAGL